MKKFLKIITAMILMFLLIFTFFSIKLEAASSSNYYITVNYGSNVVTIYTKDSNGNYTVPYKSMICSTGTATPTSGTYSLNYKYRWLALVGGVYGQYCTRITGNILFHSVPYTKLGDTSSLEYWEYDKLGTSASAGCVRLTVEDAKWIYENCPSGTKVTFYSSSDTGPLGKPTALKISDSLNRNWDPTDPDDNNPWKDILNVTFNATYYADKYADLKATYGYDEKLLKNHWYTYGISEGRQASPILDLQYYVENNTDIKNAFGTDYTLAYYHYINYGYAENRRTSNDYYVTFYKNYYNDLNSMSNLQAALHYINYGISEGRIGSVSADLLRAVFNSTYYADNNADLKSTFEYDENALVVHWFQYGIKEGRQASYTFDVKYYLSYNVDLVQAFGVNYNSAFLHFVNYGVNELRKTSSNFNISAYRKYLDLVNAYGTNYVKYYEHYNLYGYKENRISI